jgi:hypothetical protein
MQTAQKFIILGRLRDFSEQAVQSLGASASQENYYQRTILLVRRLYNLVKLDASNRLFVGQHFVFELLRQLFEAIVRATEPNICACGPAPDILLSDRSQVLITPGRTGFTTWSCRAELYHAAAFYTRSIVKQPDFK